MSFAKIAGVGTLCVLSALLGAFVNSRYATPRFESVRDALYKACVVSDMRDRDGITFDEGCNRVAIDSALAQIYQRSYVPPLFPEGREEQELEMDTLAGLPAAEVRP